MRIVLYTDGEFPPPRESALSWIQELAREIKAKGISVVFFAPDTDKLLPTDIVHVFGHGNHENWFWLKSLAAKVIVSPYPGSPPVPVKPRRWLHSLRKALRPGSRILDEATFCDSVDYFLPFEPGTPAIDAARRATSLYASLSTEI